jgi:hypothetical protein
VRAHEAAGVCRLAGVAIAGGVRRVQQTHAGIASRVFGVVET